MAAWGAHVWIGARGEEKLKDALEGVRACALDAEQRFGYVAVDVSDKGSVKAACDAS